VRLVFTATAWEQYLSHTDRKLVKRINDLIADGMRNGYEGIGKPEPLRGELSGFWSRRIDREHRLVYRIKGQRAAGETHLDARCRRSRARWWLSVKPSVDAYVGSNPTPATLEERPLTSMDAVKGRSLSVRLCPTAAGWRRPVCEQYMRKLEPHVPKGSSCC
jgi:toxin YoeB